MSTLVELLNIICTGSLADFTRFQQSNADIISEFGIDATDVVHSIRLMTLCALGCEKSSLTFQEIATALDVRDDEVEEWVVEAVGEGILEAHMDQVNSTISVRFVAYLILEFNLP